MTKEKIVEFEYWYCRRKIKTMWGVVRKSGKDTVIKNLEGHDKTFVFYSSEITMTYKYHFIINNKLLNNK